MHTNSQTLQFSKKGKKKKESCNCSCSIDFDSYSLQQIRQKSLPFLGNGHESRNYTEPAVWIPTEDINNLLFYIFWVVDLGLRTFCLMVPECSSLFAFCFVSLHFIAFPSVPRWKCCSLSRYLKHGYMSYLTSVIILHC